MKVLITHERFAPDFVGGGERTVYTIAKGLKSRGIEVQVLTTGDPKVKWFEDIQ